MNTRQDRTEEQKVERVIIKIPEHVKRKMKGSKRYKKENCKPVPKRERFFTHSEAVKPWWIRLKAFIKRVIGRK